MKKSKNPLKVLLFAALAGGRFASAERERAQTALAPELRPLKFLYVETIEAPPARTGKTDDEAH